MHRDIHSKIKVVDELARTLEALRKKGKKIVHCHGVFDLLHPGHIKHFEAAKKKGDTLVVTVTRDEFVNKGPGRPIFNHDLRAQSIAAIECVDFVAVNLWPTATEVIKLLRPHFYVKGSDYAARDGDLTGKIYEEEEAVKAVGGVMHFTDEITFSSSSLINNFLKPYPGEAADFFAKFKQKYSTADIIGRLKNIEKLKVLVIGDIIIDEYHYCVGLGKSQKDTMIATRFVNDEVFAGGVLAAANHIAGFCKELTLLSCIGTKNDYRDFIIRSLKPNINAKFFDHNDAPTVVKRRFVDPAFLNKLFEICYLDETNTLSVSAEKEICRYLNAQLKEFDLVLVTDFGHGMISPRILKILARKAGYLAINVQTNSANIGYNLVTKFPRADFVCIDEPELRLACHDKITDLEKLITQISKKLSCEKVIVTRGHKGSLAYSKKEGFFKIPIFSKEVVDRIGAGDAYFSVTAPCVFAGNPMEVAGFIGNAVGAMKVLIVGNRSSVEPVPLFKYINTLLK